MSAAGHLGEIRFALLGLPPQPTGGGDQLGDQLGEPTGGGVFKFRLKLENVRVRVRVQVQRLQVVFKCNVFK
jgi:hypothetical protein